MKYASDLADGLSDLAQADTTWKIKPEKFDPAAHLEKALQDDTDREVAARSSRRRTSSISALRRSLADTAISSEGRLAGGARDRAG